VETGCSVIGSQIVEKAAQATVIPSAKRVRDLSSMYDVFYNRFGLEIGTHMDGHSVNPQIAVF
jgi:hypothetical protein